MCKPDTQAILLNESLAEKLGGESQLDFLIMTFCEDVHEDDDLKILSKEMDIESMQILMKSFIQASFESNIFDDSVRNDVVLKSYALFESGFNTGHFNILETHFESAMHNCWVEEEVLDECKKRFSTLRSIFEEEGKDIEQNALAQRHECAIRVRLACS